MNKPQIKTDNSFLETKVKLRMDNLPPGEVRVLDCYHGEGVIWRTIKERMPGRDIEVLGIDTRSVGESHLQGDNMKFLPSMDLRYFNVIDMDAYGVPHKQLNAIFSRPTCNNAVVFVTFIQSVFGKLPDAMLEELGYSKAMVSKCQTLFCRNGFEKLMQYLALHGIDKIKVYSNSKKKHDEQDERLSDPLKAYGYQWRKERKRFLAENPNCMECERIGIKKKATIVDHTEPHKGDPVVFWDQRKWQGLCVTCHNTKSGWEVGRKNYLCFLLKNSER